MDLKVSLKLFIHVLYHNNLFLGRELKEEEKYELIAAATYMHIKKEELARQFINQDRCNYIEISVIYVLLAVI